MLLLMKNRKDIISRVHLLSELEFNEHWDIIVALYKNETHTKISFCKMYLFTQALMDTISTQEKLKKALSV